ncbi:MAG: peroxiredoxin family protein [Acidimicrobiales bacterium]
MRLATSYDRIHGAGAEVVAISVDDMVRQAGMARRWGLTHTRMVADPGGERWLQTLGLFDPHERGGIALPGMIVVTPDGTETYRYQGRDFADRTNDDDLWIALDSLGLPAVDPPPWVPGIDVPADLRGYFRPDDLGSYFRGNMFGAIAIAGRLAEAEAKAVANQHRAMAKHTLDAWEAHRTTLA